MATTKQELLRAQEAMDVVCDLARILNTNLDRETLGILVGLLEQEEIGVNPEALAEVVKELRKESQQQQQAAAPAAKLASAQSSQLKTH